MLQAITHSSSSYNLLRRSPVFSYLNGRSVTDLCKGCSPDCLYFILYNKENKGPCPHYEDHQINANPIDRARVQPLSEDNLSTQNCFNLAKKCPSPSQKWSGLVGSFVENHK